MCKLQAPLQAMFVYNTYSSYKSINCGIDETSADKMDVEN